MEFFEAIKSIISREKKDKTNSWTYEQFREYLLSLTRGKEFLLSSEEYPEKIQLSKDWQEILDNMRKESADGYERWALIGFKADRRSLYLPEVSAKGATTHVPGMIMLETLDRAKSQFHMVDMVGDIHTHPQTSKAIFSAGDLYTLLISEQYAKNNSMIMALGEYEDIIAFKTRDTEVVTLPTSVFSQESFEKYWYDKNGEADQWNVNLDIATRHKVVLYKGKRDGLFIRQFLQAK